MSEIILSVRNLSTSISIGGKAYKVVDDLSFDLKKGKTLAVVGESGCGKTMTAYSIMRILPIPPALSSTGEVIYQGENLLTLPESKMQKIRGGKIAMIFQDPRSAFNPVYTIGSQLLEVANVHLGFTGLKAEERVLQVLNDVSLPDPKKRLTEFPHQMSGGMLQRAMIASALICEPDILIADEPTTALDVTIQAQILETLAQIQKKRGLALLLITHDMGVVAEIADEVIVMYATEKIEQGSVFDLFDSPLHPYTQALFQTHFHFPLKKGKLPVIKGSVPPITNIPEGCHFHTRCRYVMNICKKNEVPFFRQGEGQQVKCWLYDENLKERAYEDT